MEQTNLLGPGEKRRIQIGVTRRVFEITDDKKEAARLFEKLYREIKNQFGVHTYKDVKRKDLQSVIQLIEKWSP
ncbi:ORF6C domain-containing protein [Peribacillus frigoritolerans]|uniref:ORF6C domain-containing protein n=1 Tax=Peribacillus frigoritolerans TaxID=450367 RepID=UPI0007BF51FC